VSRVGRIPLEAALVRVWRDGTPVGAGFLAGPRHILTAAHVVADALRVPASATMPTAAVEVDFPLLSAGHRLAAQVVAWSPVGEDLRGDIAGLRLLDPAPAGALPLVLTRSHDLAADQLIMVGFPRGLELGSWLHGRRGGPVATGWVEILSEPGRESALAPGFSGAPVWATELDAAVGMVVRRVSGAAPKIGYMITVSALLSAWPELAEVIERAPPFRALRAYGEQDAALFVGREEQSAQLARLAGTAPVVCVVGPSGVGKSSLLQAGVLPCLRSGSGQVVAVLRPSDASTPGHALALALDRVIAPERAALDRVGRAAALARRLASGAIADVVAAVLAERAAERLVIAVDQFEETFGYPPEEQEAFAAVLRGALAPAARWSVVLVLRDTFLGATLRNPAMAELAARWVPITVAELAPSQLRRAITEPLTRIGTVDYEPGLVARLLDDAQGAPSALPLLQFTLTELWHRRRHGLLLHSSYDEMGGVRGALAGYADDVWAGLDPAAQREAERLLIQLVRPLSDDGLSVRRTAPHDELTPAQWAIAQRLAGARLLVLRAAPEPGVELAHDLLLVEWQRLRDLIAQHREFRVWQDALRQRMAGWSDEGSAPRRLLAGVDLRDANRWATRHSADLSPAERTYLALSNQRRRRALVRLALALAVVVVVALVTYRSAGQQRAEIAADDLASKATRLRPFDSYGATQLAIRAYRTNSDVGFGTQRVSSYPGVDRLLPNYIMATTPRSAPVPSGGQETSSQPSQVAEPAFPMASADGRRMVTTDSAGRVVVWTVDGSTVSATPLHYLFNALDRTTLVTISRSGRYVGFVQTVFPVVPTDVHAPADEDGLPKVNPDEYHTCRPSDIASILTCLVVYDIDNQRVLCALALGGVGTLVTGFSIDPDEETVGAVLPGSWNLRAAESSENMLVRWDLRAGRQLETIRIPWRSWIAGLWLGPGGRTAILREAIPRTDGVAGPDRFPLTVVDLGASPSKREIAGPVEQVTMSLDRRRVVAIVSTPDGTKQAVVWDTRTLAVITRVSDLSTVEARGSFVLDATGSALLSSWKPDLPVDMPTDVRQHISRDLNLTVWSLPEGSRQPAGQTYDPAWSAIVPLGDVASGPIALLHTSTVGLVLPHGGQPPPLHRLAAARAQDGELPTGELISRWCGLMADPNTDTAVRKLVPQDADQGPLCPN
jgi:hypothetical protein